MTSTVTEILPLDKPYNSKLNEFDELLEKFSPECEENCGVCYKFLTQLRKHIRETHLPIIHNHTAPDPQPDLSDPSPFHHRPPSQDPLSLCQTIYIQSQRSDEGLQKRAASNSTEQDEEQDQGQAIFDTPSTSNVNPATLFSITPRVIEDPEPMDLNLNSAAFIAVESVTVKCELEVEENQIIEEDSYFTQYGSHGSPNPQQLVHAGVDERPNKCDECGNAYKSRRALALHKTTHTEQKSFVCGFCSMCFADNIILTIHMRTEHMGDGVPVPGAAAVSVQLPVEPKPKVRSHKKKIPTATATTSTSSVSESFICEYCEKSFLNKKTLRVHRKIHTYGKPHVCPECGKCFTRKAFLADHSTIHTGEKSHVCQICGKGFSQKSHLKTHHRIHTQEKPFTCNDCGECFTYSATLATHRRQAHTGEKPYVCEDCGKSFASRPCLTKHCKIHIGVRSHSCQECGKSFLLSCGLSRHLKTHLRAAQLENPNPDSSELSHHLKTHLKAHFGNPDSD